MRNRNKQLHPAPTDVRLPRATVTSDRSAYAVSASSYAAAPQRAQRAPMSCTSKYACAQVGSPPLRAPHVFENVCARLSVCLCVCVCVCVCVCICVRECEIAGTSYLHKNISVCRNRPQRRGRDVDHTGGRHELMRTPQHAGYCALSQTARNGTRAQTNTHPHTDRKPLTDVQHQPH
jgi:hypothetical protein